ncbi:MAG TPA: hypothetical protein VM204_01710, partial [Gaiellaceae bacterium]|nr:hypothetical protein [Gaiellaceae bacterium]
MFAELVLRRAAAMVFAAVVVGASAPADARIARPSAEARSGPGRAEPPARSGPIDRAERTTIAARIAYVRESDDGRRRAYVASARGDDELAVTVGDGDTYPAGATPDGALVVLRAEDHGSVHEESLLRVEVATGAQRELGRATRIRNPAIARDGAIAFESDASSFRDLFVIRGAAGPATRLTDDPEGNYEPSFFPDGRTIAFTSSRDGEAEVYAMSIDGREVRRLTSAHGDDMRPLAAPEGGRIAFISGRTGQDRIFVMGLDGQGQRPVRRGAGDESEREHAWSPDGRRLVFVARGGPASKSR